MLALSMATASLPVVGRHLEPLGGVTAMGVWGYRHVPGFLSTSAKSWFTPGIGEIRKAERGQTQAVSDAALRGVVPGKDLDIEWPAPERTPPFWKAREHRRHLRRTSVRYGSHPVQLLDVWRRKDLPVRPAPVLIFVPGGAWVHGGRMLQGSALMSHLAEQGWVCLAMRLPGRRRTTAGRATSPTSRPPSRGRGPTSTSSAVTAISLRWRVVRPAGTCPRWPDSPPTTPSTQTELPEGSDSSVDAVVGIYGRYDWEDRSTPERDRFVDFLERVVVKRRIDRHPEVFRDASPIARVHPECAAVLGDSRQQRQRHPGRAGPQLRRAAAGDVAFDGRLPGAARRRATAST